MKTIIAHPNFEYMAKEIAQRNPDKIRLGKIQFWKFKDGWPNLWINDVRMLVEHQNVTYLWDYSRPEDVFMNFSVVQALSDYYADKVRSIMPYFPVGQTERICDADKWEAATAPYFADYVSHFPTARSQKPSIHTFDIHALWERFLFNRYTTNAELHTIMKDLVIPNDTIIVFPDDWAEKRFWKYYPNHERIICSKIRIGADGRKVTIKEWNPNGRNVLIIDDLIQTGWTMIETVHLLRSSWAKSVDALSTHGVFPEDSHLKLSKEVDHLIVTDTIPANIERAKSVDNMQIISIAPLIERILFRNKE